MKLLHKLSLLFLIIFPMTTQASPLSISEQEINQYLATRLAEKVSLQDSLGVPRLFQLDYKLSDLYTKVGQTDEKVVDISGIIDSLLQIKGKEYQVKLNINMDTLPFYDMEKGALFLKNVRLKNWNATPEKYQNELQVFLPIIADGLTNILNSHPVYTLDERKTKESLVKKFGKHIIVEKGHIRLETNIF
ncbi:DUF1439 domain-containing protein [Glaesserella parasuis]|uniref:DUF1439 domain-containing protein n=1 Tax=Glaesserella parasuis TaxID=738 RepID=UPI0013665D8D|nr:DUF1439 domain-containing protein [Glaesserella parasuis]MCT8540858.1 DUF1439 domain-containing protein [Glaesserella parasuis]MCT8564150.1 DUF1439 domain-containing protein [Glaesserella parasuis]MCT8589890.1 DUF1439 domain-containing protein [Glaesserella parasuis]MCT8632263.1 DUF1439 domain-containing protein [Glaesserella parasuis]MCT8639976.1 DUF1439 domain-containing protein [Glaesserella parasuis]